jgi:hypothetical protein
LVFDMLQQFRLVLILINVKTYKYWFSATTKDKAQNQCFTGALPHTNIDEVLSIPNQCTIYLKS